MAASSESRRQFTTSCGLFLGRILLNSDYFWRSGVNQTLTLYSALLGGQVHQMCKRSSIHFPKGLQRLQCSSSMMMSNVGCGKGGGIVVDRKK